MCYKRYSAYSTCGFQVADATPLLFRPCKSYQGAKGHCPGTVVFQPAFLERELDRCEACADLFNCLDNAYEAVEEFLAGLPCVSKKEQGDVPRSIAAFKQRQKTSLAAEWKNPLDPHATTMKHVGHEMCADEIDLVLKLLRCARMKLAQPVPEAKRARRNLMCHRGLCHMLKYTLNTTWIINGFIEYHQHGAFKRILDGFFSLGPGENDDDPVMRALKMECSLDQSIDAYMGDKPMEYFFDL
ncbi:hypothetical protein F4780DRAFT_96406 [Xylariomycetidae sp. FL0641]|nr:hypothetical protein F4780DRAFT_96406 [Xylariomycetidae sp. FL0641]